ncbi:hypothetical protein KCU88_g412, partial [Aureobasidium melanogenum]
MNNRHKGPVVVASCSAIRRTSGSNMTDYSIGADQIGAQITSSGMLDVHCHSDMLQPLQVRLCTGDSSDNKRSGSRGATMATIALILLVYPSKLQLSSLAAPFPAAKTNTDPRPLRPLCTPFTIARLASSSSLMGFDKIRIPATLLSSLLSMSKPSSITAEILPLPVMPSNQTPVTFRSWPNCTGLNKCHCSLKMGSLISSASAIESKRCTASFCWGSISLSALAVVERKFPYSSFILHSQPLGHFFGNSCRIEVGSKIVITFVIAATGTGLPKDDQHAFRSDGEKLSAGGNPQVVNAQPQSGSGIKNCRPLNESRNSEDSPVQVSASCISSTVLDRWGSRLAAVAVCIPCKLCSTLSSSLWARCRDCESSNYAAEPRAAPLHRPRH